MAKDVPFELVPQLSELRIGNILSYKGDYVHVTLLSMDVDDEYQDIIGFCKLGQSTNEISNWNRAMAGDLLRVAITPDLLESCGFEKSYDKALPFQDAYTFEWVTLDRDFQISIACEDSVIRIGEPLKYLHEVQNVIYFLTKKEIPVNLNQLA